MSFESVSGLTSVGAYALMMRMRESPICTSIPIILDVFLSGSP